MDRLPGNAWAHGVKLRDGECHRNQTADGPEGFGPTESGKGETVAAYA
jgi:hypothetical protein